MLNLESQQQTYIWLFDLFIEFLSQLLILFNLFGERDLYTALRLLKLLDFSQSSLKRDTTLLLERRRSRLHRAIKNHKLPFSIMETAEIDRCDDSHLPCLFRFSCMAKCTWVEADSHVGGTSPWGCHGSSPGYICCSCLLHLVIHHSSIEKFSVNTFLKVSFFKFKATLKYIYL